MRKSFVLDTNVLLHNAEAIHSFADNEVVIPIDVIEELDQFKKENTDLGRNARAAIRTLDALREKGRLGEGVPLNEEGGTLRVVLKPGPLTQAGLTEDTPDNRILSVAYEIHSRGQKVVFVSKDINARIKSDALGLTTMDFEKQTGWVPQNVSEQTLGFDIRSTKYDINGTFKAIRYIEVKARARSGSVYISANEWKKAKRFGEDYWLYIITEAGTKNPKLTRLRNPAVKFKIDEDIYATGYLIPLESWVKIGKHARMAG